MVQFRIPALVLGGFVWTDLGAVRALGRAGVTVYYLSDNKNEVTYSKYCKKHFIFKNLDSKEELARALRKLKKSLGSAVLFPTSDLHAITLSELSLELDGYYFTVPREGILETLINKKKFYESLMKHGVLHPVTCFPENIEEVKDAALEIHFPVFLKPYFSQQFRDIFIEKVSKFVQKRIC